MATYQEWLKADLPADLRRELVSLQEADIEERFGRYLSFGTGGLRGEIGAGTGRMNIYTVRRAAAGVARMVLRMEPERSQRGVLIAYDTRRKSAEFAEAAALALCAAGVPAVVFDRPAPTPLLSFAVRFCRAAAGIVITASHNPPSYNGFKVYDSAGCQLTPALAEELTADIEAAGDELAVPVLDRETAEEFGLYRAAGGWIFEAYLCELKRLMLEPELVRRTGDKLKIVYTPLHGTGAWPVCEALDAAGFRSVAVVPEQERPDGEFPTVRSPNPEEPEAFALAVRLAVRTEADLVLATDPDADRVGVMARDADGSYVRLTGNDIGALLLDYILSRRQASGTLPEDGVVAKTIVTSDLGRRIAEHYGVRMAETLTGFKYIGELMEKCERGGGSFLFGYEESCGYVAGGFVRDKDGVQACLLIAEMAAWHLARGVTLPEALRRLHERFGYYADDLISVEYRGLSGERIMAGIMERVRREPFTSVAGIATDRISDYGRGTFMDLARGHAGPTGLPLSDVVKFELEDGSWIVFRPSGTEPKMKIYLSVRGENRPSALRKLSLIRDAVRERLPDGEAAAKSRLRAV